MNQPLGFIVSATRRPSYYYGRRHDYVFYPEAWTDPTSGRDYEKGYYDENGQYYDSVSFSKDGQYENVVCHCPYCGQNTVLNLSAKDAAAHNLKCPSCGGPMEIQSELDDYVNQAAENTHTYQSEESLRQFNGKPKKKRRWWIVLAILVAMGLYGKYLEIKEERVYTPQTQTIQQISGMKAEYGSAVYLTKIGQNSYTVSSSKSGDKKLTWDASADSYYDASTECWLWYNTDVEPPLWQYWFEGISSDYGDYGWMEHDASGWYIETSEGNWIRLPGSYDTSRLWYIEG